jgi:hypothetical protein
LSHNDDVLDVSLHDHELHDEVVLTTHLIIAANESPGRLSQSHVDRILGVRQPSEA